MHFLIPKSSLFISVTFLIDRGEFCVRVNKNQIEGKLLPIRWGGYIFLFDAQRELDHIPLSLVARISAAQTSVPHRCPLVRLLHRAGYNNA